MPCGCSKIYSVKASKPGARVGGMRLKAPNMHDATKQAIDYLNGYGTGWNVQISELKNQKAALKKWDAEHD